MSQGTLPLRLEGLIVNDDDVTPTLLNPLNGHIYLTNKVGQRVIEMCDGKRTVDEIVRSLSAEFRGATPEAIEADVNKFLEFALKNGVITWRNEI